LSGPIGMNQSGAVLSEAPWRWHPILGVKPYEINKPPRWLRTMAPNLRALTDKLEYAMPLVTPVLGYSVAEVAKKFEADLKLIEAFVKALPDIATAEDDPLHYQGLKETALKKSEGADLRVLHRLPLDKDPKRNWAGLRHVITPENHHLWLCE
jgi:hypothetical protein